MTNSGYILHLYYREIKVAETKERLQLIRYNVCVLHAELSPNALRFLLRRISARTREL